MRMPAPKPKRVSLQLRLSLTEIDIIEAVVARMGDQALRRDLVEEALRHYLRIVDKAGKFVQRPRGGGSERRKLSQRPARRYMVDEKVVRELDRIANDNHWPKSELVRQAIMTYGEQHGIAV